MKPAIASDCETVEVVFASRRKLRVPYFQRGYAWQQEHAERLIADLIFHASGRAPLDWYPLGSIILSRGQEQGDVDVADGHQRLITLTILLAALRDREPDASRRARLSRCIFDDDGLPRFATLQDASDLLLAAVQREGATLQPQASSDGDDELSPSEAAILENLDVVSRRLGDLDEPMRRLLADFVLERTLLVAVSVDGDAAARLLFATMHETGVKPKTADLLKSRVLGKCRGDDRETAQTVWEGLEARLGRDRMEGLLLSVAAIRARAMPCEHPDVALAQAFDFDQPGMARRFVMEHLRPIGSHLLEILNAGLDPAAQPGPVYRRLQYLGWVIRHDTWRLPALHWLSLQSIEAPETLTFLKRLETLAWVQMIRAEDVLRRDRRYLEILGDIDRGEALEAGSALTILPAERAAVRAVLTAPNFARRPYKLFLLLRLNAIAEGDEAVGITPEATVEHVYPQRPGFNSRWMDDYGREADAATLKHMLGNLTLLTEREQNHAANRDFDAKRGIYAESAFSLSRRLGGLSTWPPDAIRARTEQMTHDLMAALDIA